MFTFDYEIHVRYVLYIGAYVFLKKFRSIFPIYKQYFMFTTNNDFLNPEESIKKVQFFLLL